ncbi:MAG TPA: choice-of-anchor D domain-containing protein [Tepidisphaeraceae bacterium]|nr:choice-of-anchor D domain-containing protein [Tepidisphaeraceae bacterium]
MKKSASCHSLFVEAMEPRRLLANVTLPFELNFDRPRGGIQDSDGHTSGFTLVQDTGQGTALQSGLLDVRYGARVFEIVADGDSSQTSNTNENDSLPNILQVPFDATGEIKQISTRLDGTFGGFNHSGDQAGIVFGSNQDQFFKLVLARTNSGAVVNFYGEIEDDGDFETPLGSSGSSSTLSNFSSIEKLDLHLIINRSSRTLEAFYNIDGGKLTKVGSKLTLTNDQANLFMTSTARAGVMVMNNPDEDSLKARFEAFSISTRPQLSVAGGKLFFSDVRDNSPGIAQSITVKNKGTGPLVLGENAFSFSGTNSGLFETVGSTSATIRPGKSRAFDVRLTALNNTPVDSVFNSKLTIFSNDPRGSSSIDLRSVVSPSAGGEGEPSFARLVELFQIPIDVGDEDPSTIAIDDQNNLPDEVFAPAFTKAGDGPVSIVPISSYTVHTETTSATIGYYDPGSRDSQTQLLRIDADNWQTVSPKRIGTTSFDPGTRAFSIYGTFPDFLDDGKPRVVYGEDALNDWETNPDQRRKIRVYNYRNPEGNIVANKYLVAFEEWEVSTDQNDILLVVSNVKPSTGQEIGLTSVDGGPSPSRVIFNKITIEDSEDGNDFHDRTKIRIENTGNKSLVISGIDVGGSGFGIQNMPSFPLTIERRSHFDLSIRFTATTGSVYSGKITIRSNDKDEPTKIVDLSGFRQSYSEMDPNQVSQEPTLQQLNAMFGYKTVITHTGESVDTQGEAIAIGDEVLSGYWKAADAGSPVIVKTLASYHTIPDEAQFRWHPKGSPNSNTTVFRTEGMDAQSVIPRNALDNTKWAEGSFTPPGVFGLRVESEFSDDELNWTIGEAEEGRGHRFRFYPVKNYSGQYVPNTWLVAMDYSAINYDYNDNIYVISNMMPENGINLPESLSGYAKSDGVQLGWGSAEVVDGYRVYRSTSANGTYSLVSGGTITSSSYLDKKANPNKTWYYRVTSVSDGDESLPIGQRIFGV